MDYSKLTLGELISHSNETIRRNAMSILKQLQKIEYDKGIDEAKAAYDKEIEELKKGK